MKTDVSDIIIHSASEHTIIFQTATQSNNNSNSNSNSNNNNNNNKYVMLCYVMV